MGAATTPDKTPKPPRPPKSPIHRQVHFAEDKQDTSVKVTTAAEYAANLNKNHSQTAATSAAATPVTVGAPTGTTAATEDTFAQPSSYPALGQFQQQQQPGAPNSNLPGGSGQWFTSANPAQSVNSWQHSGPGCASGPGHLHQHQHQPFAHPHLTCPHHQHQHHHSTNMSYQNTAPPPTGVNFQPPVPDSSNGPMTHVYIPRFDGGLPQQAPFPQNQFVGVGLPPGVQQHPPGCQAHGPGFVAQPQPVYLQQAPMMMAAGAHPPGMAQPGPHLQAGGGPFVSGGQCGVPPFLAGNTGPVPEVAGLGRTAGEEQMRQLNFAKGNKLFEPQDFKPSDDDPSRFYYVRELDGNWTQRNRFSIDHMGDCRWYVTDEGWFYAIRLPN